MASQDRDERLVMRLVTYTIEIDGKVIVVEHVPARVDEETGERYFSPETVDRLQQIVREGRSPTRVIEAPVFDFAA
jgi:YgiT-type zinc finger domain-containing protein